MNVPNPHHKIMKSSGAAPRVHAAAVKNPAMRGGPFVEGQRARRLRADTYTIALMRHGVNGITNDIAWLDELITAERVRVTEDRGEVDDSVEPSQAPEPPHDSTDVTESTSPFIRRQEPQA